MASVGGAWAQDRTRDQGQVRDESGDRAPDRIRDRTRDPLRDEDIYGTQFMT